MIRTLTRMCLRTFCFLVVVFLSLNLSQAQVMQSGSFQMQSDSINFAGGLSTSSNYKIESTAGEIATGNGESSNYKLRAGYQQMQEVYLALSGATNVLMSPALSGVTGGVSNGSTTVTVITDSPAGYSLSIQSEGTPSMRSLSSSLNDYVPVGNPDFSFITGVSDAHFGFSPEGADTVPRFKDNGSLCNIGSLNSTLACWDGISTTSKTIARSVDANHPQGSTTTIRFRVAIGSGVAQAPGTYTATTTLTALPL